MNGADLIAAERKEQMTREGWTPDHDAHHTEGELVEAALCYAVFGLPEQVITHRYDDFLGPSWPWSLQDWKPKDRIRNLVRAGALIAAEIDRILAHEP